MICISRICATDNWKTIVRWQVEKKIGDGDWIVIDTFYTYKAMRVKYPHQKIIKSCECDCEDARNSRCMYRMGKKK